MLKRRKAASETGLGEANPEKGPTKRRSRSRDDWRSHAAWARREQASEASDAAEHATWVREDFRL